MFNIFFDSIQNPSVVAIIVAVLGGIFALERFKQEQKLIRYASFIDDIDKALVLGKKRKRILANKQNSSDIEDEIELVLNKAYSKAMVLLPDKIFRKITKLLDKDFDKHKRNRIYYILRKDLYPFTKISFEDVMTKYMEIK